ncbi:Small glutamine-rich tetratricopeptide repeat-containing protein 2 [Fusarium oxysporum f. sp. albedinis]|nr:Small glutamine-rich tetratricopeptide repeat-containing protein 2 [Fusarium oxysporum f. sp. albedinis]
MADVPLAFQTPSSVDSEQRHETASRIKGVFLYIQGGAQHVQACPPQSYVSKNAPQRFPLGLEAVTAHNSSFLLAT